MNTLSIILGLPLLGFIINGIFGSKIPKSLSGGIGTISVFLSFIFSLMALPMFVENAEYTIKLDLFTFLSFDTFNLRVAFTLDRLSLWMTLIVTGIGTLIHVYSISYMKEDEGFYKFFAYLNFFIFNMLLLILGSNFIMLFFGWEGVGLCSYLLIGFWYKNAEYGKAARKAFIMNRIGDLGLLLGIFMIIQQFGTLEFTTVFEEINKGTVSVNTLNAIGILLFIGAMGKSAQIPLFTWLPDAMAGPTPVSALIHAATMVTAGIYLVIRCSALYVLSPIANEVIIWTGLSTAIVAALIGLKQNDIKKVLAYSTVSQLGFMFVALGCGAYTTALFHVTTHAFFKALLFLGAGSVIHGMHHEQDIRKMGGLKSKMPITHFTFLIGTLAITGFPFLSGFFSKDEILTIAFNHNIVIYILLVGSALLTGIYMFRLLFVTFYGEYRNHHYSFDKVHESPRLMNLPLIILAVLSILGGLLNLPHYLQHEGGILQNWLKPILGHTHSAQHEISFNTEMILVSIAVLVFVTALLLTRMRYISRKHIPQEQTPTGVLGIISNKFYFDEIYDFVFVKPFETMSIWLQQVFELKIVSKISYGIHDILRFFGGLNKKIQNGNIEYYLMFMVIGVLILLGFNFFN